MFLETLVDFITVHKEDLQDWLFVLLTQLLKKMGADLLGSVQAKVQKALDITRSEEQIWQIGQECLVHILTLVSGSDKMHDAFQVLLTAHFQNENRRKVQCLA